MPWSVRAGSPSCPLVAALIALALVGCGDDKSTTIDAGSDSASSTSAGTSSAGTSSAGTSSAGTTAATTTAATTGSGSEGTSTGSTTSSTSTSSTSASTGESESTGACGDCFNPEYLCCDGCIDPRNDANNCGGCGIVCADPTPYCGGGTCQATPCATECGDPSTCCGGQCCDAGTICCEINGPIQSGPGCALPTERGTCSPGCAPLCQCAAPDTPIATPEGERPIAALQVGDWVYSIDGAQTVAVPIAEIRVTPVLDHEVVRIVLDDGAELRISGLHPLGDGRPVAALRVGDRLGDHTVTEVAQVPYPHPATHDILPASSSGVYFVHGARIGSTIRPPVIERASTR
ncbi:MAG: Hint domain-containing protein [Nannocystaceae bacterium]